ncbi:MAG: hypothetical protein K6C13_05395 [Oscillospiraceae bacterium]|nr:hypothetical protein [Oscillospiraceae bacterium]
MKDHDPLAIVLSVICGIILAVVLCNVPGFNTFFPMASMFAAVGSVFLMFVIYGVFRKNIAEKGRARGIKYTFAEFLIFLALLILCIIFKIDPFEED